MSELELETIYFCPKCGWVRPEGRSRHCGKCNSTLVPKIIKEPGKIIHYIGNHKVTYLIDEEGKYHLQNVEKWKK